MLFASAKSVRKIPFHHSLLLVASKKYPRNKSEKIFWLRGWGFIKSGVLCPLVEIVVCHRFGTLSSAYSFSPPLPCSLHRPPGAVARALPNQPLYPAHLQPARAGCRYACTKITAPCVLKKRKRRPCRRLFLCLCRKSATEKRRWQKSFFAYLLTNGKSCGIVLWQVTER